MLFEDQRAIHEDLERLEEAIASQFLEEPANIRERLHRDHEVAGFLARMQEQSKRLKDVYSDPEGLRQQEVERLATGDTFAEFYKEFNSIKDFHRRYPNEPVENLERAYRPRQTADGEPRQSEVDGMFSGEEAWGRYFDLVQQHEMYLNLKGGRTGRRINYLQYIDAFDRFASPQYPLTRKEKLSTEYFEYITQLADYLQSFMTRTRPLENLDEIFAGIQTDFAKAWEEQKVEGWAAENESAGPTTQGSGEGVWCADCQKEFLNDNVYKGHLTGRKHIKNAKERAENGASSAAPAPSGASSSSLRERAVAEREHRVTKLASMMQTTRHDTKVNVERRAGMTEKERQAERESLLAEAERQPGAAAEPDAADDDDKIHNPLKLPLSWDGRPIPYWLYKLHGLGVEYACEICGGYVYAGRRAFEKHFGEPRHTWGLRCLGIANGVLFREITSIAEAERLQTKIEGDRKAERARTKDVEEMEDSLGNVMPRKVYEDLQAAGMV